MIERNTETNETHVFCDYCQKELTNEPVYVLNTGNSICKECFDTSYKVMSVEEYINENTIQK